MTENMEYPPLHTIIKPETSEYEKGFLKQEYEAGLAYYLRRLDRIMFSGEHALDAGCGAGQWSLALSQRFEHVTAIDRNPERLKVLNTAAKKMGISSITVDEGSIEQLPYTNNTFDSVFCYGVIMFTNLRRVLEEFSRVLRPGGRVYLCLNGDGWSHKLMADSNVNNQKIGRETLYTTYLERGRAAGVATRLRAEKDFWGSLVHPSVRSILSRTLGPLNSMRPTRLAFHPFLLNWLRRDPDGRALLGGVRNLCAAQYLRHYTEDLLAIMNAKNPPRRFGYTRAWLPGELDDIASELGFSSFQWAVEAGLECNWKSPPLASKYDGEYANMLAVWECLFDKPEPLTGPVDSERHIRAARAAGEESLFLGSSQAPIISNALTTTYPLQLFNHARSVAKQLGGRAYLKRLTDQLTKDAHSEEEVIRCLVRFVQLALFRDPVSQPMLESGSLPDALTCLLTARGRCGHVSQLLTALFEQAGFHSRVHQLPNHIFTEVFCDDRWAIIDADAFKHGVMPTDRNGQFPTLKQLEEDPYLMDRFPPTGWMQLPDSRLARSWHKAQVHGYVDILEPEQRGFVSGYYLPQASGSPPSLPRVTNCEVKNQVLKLSWTSSQVREGALVGYRVSLGSRSRGWSYDDLHQSRDPYAPPTSDLLYTETILENLETPIPDGIKTVYASVTAVSDRIEKEPDTFFWPSKESCYEINS